MKRLLITLLFLSSVYTLSAQVRMGVRVGYPITSLAQQEYGYDQIVQTPAMGLYVQKWMSDRRFRYAELYYESLYMERFNHGWIYNDVTRITNVAFHAGYGAYLRHREFEDNFAFYYSLASGIGISRIRNVNVERDQLGVYDLNEEKVIWPYYALIDAAIGVEKRLSHRYFLNSSVHANVGINPYVGVVLRVTRSMY